MTTRTAKFVKTENPRDVYAIVTERIVELLESGTVPWRKPWNPELGMPRSLSTGKAYRGINIWLLGSQQRASQWWGTYEQIQERGGQVRKGEKGTLVVFWKTYGAMETDAETGEESERTRMVLRYFKVFNADQCEPMPTLPKADETEAIEIEPIETAEAVMGAFFGRADAPSLSYGGGRACYSPGADHVQLPERKSFSGAEEFYSTAFHEMTHSTGHRSRLGRKDLLESHAFGDENYSREELVAEMGAAMLCGVTEIELHTLENSAAYLNHWVHVLKGDSRMVVIAAAQAQKAADLILGTPIES